MPRVILLALAAALLLLPATADGHSGVRLRGIVTVEDATRSFVTVSSARRDHVLRVQPASLDRIRLGMRVELRGSTLHRHGNGSRVLSRGVILVRSDTHAGDVRQLDDDEIEVKGTLTSLFPLTVVANGRPFMCAVPPGVSLAGFHVGDFVEMTCDLVRGTFVLRELELEDDEVEIDDDEIEVKGTLTSLSPLRVTAHGRVFTCAVPVGVSLAGFHVGDFVEMTCDLVGGTFVLRELELEDDDLDEDERDDDDDEDDDDDDDED